MKAFGIIVGALTALWGAFALTVPIGTFMGVGWILGLLLLVTGVLLAAIGIKGDPKSFKKVLVGIIIAVFGGMIFFGAASRFFSNVMLIYIISGCLILFGIVLIYIGCKAFEKDKTKGIAIVACGVIAAIVGGIVLLKPTIAMAFVGYVIAISLIAYGVIIIVLSLRLGKKKDKDEDDKVEVKEEKPAE